MRVLGQFILEERGSERVDWIYMTSNWLMSGFVARIGDFFLFMVYLTTLLASRA